MDASLRALIVEKSSRDIALEVQALEAAGYRVTYVVAVTAAEMKAALAKQTFDIIITDHDLPRFDASEALAVLKQSGLDIPFLIISAAMDEGKAVALLKAGAHDYITKDRLSSLTSNVKNALQNAEDRRLIKQTEKALQMSEEKYRLLFANANESIFVAQEGKIVFLNPRMLKLTGYSAEEITGWPFTDLIHPDDSEMVIKRHISRLKGEQVPYSYDFRVVQKNGTVIWVKLSAVLMTWEGKPATLNFLEDITAHKLSDDALRESEEQLRDSLENAPDGVYMSDLEGNFLYGNRRCEEIIGYQREELIGKNFLELNLLPENSLGKAAKLLQAASEGRKSSIEEFDLIRKDGSLIPVEINTSMVRIKGQVAVLAFVRDITERKLAENKIKGLAKFPDENPSPVLRIAQDGTIMYANRASQVLLNQWHCSVGQRLPENWQQLVAAAVNSGLSNTFEYVCEAQVFSLIIAPIVTEKYANIYCLDITERKRAEATMLESEANLNRAQEIVHIGSWHLDIASKQLGWSNEVYRIFGRPIGTGLRYEDFLDMVHPEDRERIDRAWAAALQGEPYDIEHCLWVGDELKWIRERAEVKFDPQGKAVEATGTVQDITEHKRTQDELGKHREHLEDLVKQRTEQLAEATAQAETANLAKSDFLSNMSHELRTPLNSIIGFSEVLFDQTFGPLNETQKDYLNDVMTSGQHLLSLINDILDLSKVEAGKMQLTLSTFSLHRLLEESFVLIKEKTYKHNIHFSSEIADEVGEVQADERKIKQIIYNLLSNAVKFTPDGGRAGIRARKGAEQIEVSVWDTGIGLAAEDQNKLFEKFTQIGNIYTGKRAGTGLGLSLVKSMVELHGGKVWVESGGMDKGSTFTFTLPIRQKVDGEVRIDRG